MKTAKYTLLLLLAVFGILWRSLAVFTQDRQRPPRPPPNILGILVGGLDLSDIGWVETSRRDCGIRKTYWEKEMYSLDEIEQMDSGEQIVAQQYRKLIRQLFDRHTPKCPSCDCRLDIQWNGDDPYWRCCLCSESFSGSADLGLEQLVVFGKCGCGGLQVVRLNHESGTRFVGCSRYSRGCDFARRFGIHEGASMAAIRDEWQALKDNAIADAN